MKIKIIGIILICLILLLGVWFFLSNLDRPQSSTTVAEEMQAQENDQATIETGEYISTNSDQIIIYVDSPQPGDTVTSPISVSGQAPGYWFFEASAPVVVTNWDGLIIGEGYITAEGDWMTEDLVPFTGFISYDQPADVYSATGTIIFKRDNPSGLPENDAAFEFSIQLRPTF